MCNPRASGPDIDTQFLTNDRSLNTYPTYRNNDCTRGNWNAVYISRGTGHCARLTKREIYRRAARKICANRKSKHEREHQGRTRVYPKQAESQDRDLSSKSCYTCGTIGSRSGRVLIRIKGEAARSIRSRGIVLFPDHGVKMIKSDRPSWAGKNLYIWSRSDPRQGTNGFADLFTFMARIYGTNVRSGAYVKV